jgi:hypothetical protein
LLQRLKRCRAQGRGIVSSPHAMVRSSLARWSTSRGRKTREACSRLPPAWRVAATYARANRSNAPCGHTSVIRSTAS